MICFLRCAAAAALLVVCASAQFNCPDDSYLGGVASNVSGSTDKVLTLNITGKDKQFTLKVERKHVVGDTTTWEVIEEVPFTPGNNPPVTIPPGCRASIQDTDPADGDNDPVVGTATLT